MKYEELTRKIIGAAMEVHKHLGNGFQEVVYQRALSIELGLQDINHEREKEIHLAQAMNYLEAYNMEIGLLINFGAKSLQFKRVHNNKILDHD